MITRRTFLKYAAGTALTWYAFDKFGVLKTLAQIPGGTLDPTLVPKFQTPLLIPPVMPRAAKLVQRGGKNVDYYEISMKQIRQQILPASLPQTTVPLQAPENTTSKATTSVMRVDSIVVSP